MLVSLQGRVMAYFSLGVTSQTVEVSGLETPSSRISTGSSQRWRSLALRKQ